MSRKSFRAITLTLSLLISMISAVTSSPMANALAACEVGSTAQNNIQVNPSHSKVFYIDTGVSPRIDASYVGYRVTNTTGATLKGYWVSLSNFSGGQVTLANSSDQYMQLPDIANNKTQTVYFLLKASASSKIAQSHDVKVWSKRPDLATATNSYGCTFSFKKVAETIKASANKPTSTTVSSIPSIGGTFTVTSIGATGTIGAGNPDVGRILWFTPAAYSSFPTRAFRLEKVQIVTGDNANWNNSTDIRAYSERLLVDPTIAPEASASGLTLPSYKTFLTTTDNLVGKRYYQNTYTFRVIASAPSTSISPLAQISSGTQIKHTAIDANGTATINASAALVTASLTKSVTSTSYSSYPTATINGNSYNEVPYSLTLSSTANSTADEIVDTPPSGAIYKTGSTTIKIGSGSATSTSDPETLTAEASLNPRPLHFVGPFVTTSSSSIVIGYTMYVPAIAGTYTNTAYAKIGDRQIVASSGVSIPGVRVTVGGDGKVSGATTITVALNPDPLTAPATSIAATTATINGSIDANDTTTAGYFEWGTSSILSTNTSISLGAVSGSNPTNFSSNLTGLTAGTTYYYRIVAVSSGTRYEGAIYSFTAYEAPSAPTVTTTTPTNIGVTSATLNATIDPNLQSITKIEFFYSVNSDMSSATTVSVFDLNEDGSISTTLTTLAGASPTDVSWEISGLNTTTTYYYYAVITYSGGTVSGLPTKKSFKTGTTSQYISFAALADKPFTDSSFTRTPLASSLKTSDNGSTGLSVTYTSETTDICTVPSGGDTISFVAVGFCVITATQAGDATYAAAEPVTQSFQITPSAPTATTQAASSVAITSAVLNGDFTTGGGGSTSVSFTYGTDSALSTGTTTVTTANSPATADGSRTWSLSGLTAATTYYFRISASNTTGSANGNILNFTTQNLASQTITWTTITSKYYGDTATATAPATSGLNTTITSLTPSVCTVPNPSTSGATVTLLSLGNCVLRSAQGGNAAYLPATSVDETFTVSAKPITVTAAAKTKVYGASDPSLTYTHSPALLGSDTFTGSITRGAGENVGSYSILVGSLALPSNYQLIYVGETLTVTAKPLTITADNKSKNASDPTPTFTYQISGLVNSNTVSGVTFNFSSGSYSSSTTAPTANGTYTITPSAAVFSNGSSGNYSITYNTGTYTITSLASQTLTWTTIGNKTYGTSPTGTVVSSHAPLVVTVTSNTTSICTVPSSSVSGATITLLRVGICELKASQAGDGTTYGPASDVIETFTVLAAPLVITASSPTGIKVGDAVPTISASYSGFVNSENSSVLTTQPTCVTSYTTSSTAGATETTSCSGAAATNYSITYVAGSITVGAANNSNNNNSAPAPVVKQKTTINWGNPSPIVAGTPLSGTQLNAIFSVPGTCVYTPATGTVLPEGTHTLSVTCTPNDGVNFEPLTTTVTIQVKAAKKKPSIIWFNPSPINNPTPLSGTQLNARPSIPGNLEYSPASGTVLEPGSHVLTVKLKPNDPDYEELEAKVTILVRTKPVDPKNPTPSNPGNNAEPSKPEVKDPVAPTKPAKEAGPAAIPAAKNAPVLQTAGKAAEVITVIPNQEQTGIIVSAPDWSLAISSTTKFVQGNTADSSARVVIEKGNTVTTSGTGFKPFSQVDVFVYSTPTWLGAVITDAFGNFTTTLPMPKALPEGDHTFQAEGLTPDNLERTAAVPITLVPAVVTVKPGELRFEVYFGMNSVVITKAEAAKIARNVKSALSKAASNAKITVQVVGWVQPNPKPGDIRYLSTNRAKNVAALMKKLGLKGSYSLNFPGLEKDNLPSSRHASVVIKWSITKSASA